MQSLTGSIPPTCQGCPVRQYGVCRALGTTEIAKLKQIELRRVIAPGQTIIAEGDCATFVATIVSGVVKLTKRLADGRAQIVGFLFGCDFLGRPFASESPFTAEAVSHTILHTYRRQQFEDLLRATPGLEHNLYALMLGELDAAQNWMLLLGQKSAREKVASLILLFARHSTPLVLAGNIGPPGYDIAHNHNHHDLPLTSPIRYALPLSRAEMADCLGLRLETVSRQMSRLRAEDVIRLEAEHIVVIPRVDRLLAAAEAAQ